MEGAILSLSDLRSINSTTEDVSDKAEHKIQKESKVFYFSDLLLHNKPPQTERCKATILTLCLMILSVRNSDRTEVGNSSLFHNVWGLSWVEWEGWGWFKSLCTGISWRLLHAQIWLTWLQIRTLPGLLTKAPTYGLSLTLVLSQPGSWVLRESIPRRNTWRQNIPRQPGLFMIQLQKPHSIISIIL